MTKTERETLQKLLDDMFRIANSFGDRASESDSEYGAGIRVCARALQHTLNSMDGG